MKSQDLVAKLHYPFKFFTFLKLYSVMSFDYSIRIQLTVLLEYLDIIQVFNQAVCVYVCVYLSTYLSIYLSIYLSMFVRMHPCEQNH